MARTGLTSFVWGDGMHSFKLGIGELIELQEKCDAGPPFILARLESGYWKVEDVRETIRLGLIGAGVGPADAYRLVVRYVDDLGEHPLANNALAAQAIVSAAIVGAPDKEDAPSEKPEADHPTNPFQEGKSDGPPISEPDSQQDLAPLPSKPVAYGNTHAPLTDGFEPKA